GGSLQQVAGNPLAYSAALASIAPSTRLLAVNLADSGIGWWVVADGGLAAVSNPGAYVSVAPTRQAVALGDIDGDGLIDAVVASQAGNLWWAPGDASGQFSGFTERARAVPSPIGVVLADLEGIGKPDAITYLADFPDVYLLN